MRLFSQNSYWDDAIADMLPGPRIAADQPDRLPMPDLTTNQLQDWTYRLQNMANEAGDNHLLALESDILDLRDEILFELHGRV